MTSIAFHQLPMLQKTSVDGQIQIILANCGHILDCSTWRK